MGINLYVWAADPAFWGDIADDPRFDFFADAGDRGHPERRALNGWALHDEIDMQQGPGACPVPVEHDQGGPARGRDRQYDNYGKGIFPGWETDAQFTCFVEAQDLRPNDIYWFTDPNACTSPAEGPTLFGGPAPLAECRRASNYGAIVDRMRTPRRAARRGEADLELRGGLAPVQRGAPAVADDHRPADPGGRLALPDRGRARDHLLPALVRLNQPCYGDHHTLRSDCDGNRAAVRAVNAQVSQLAPVLNGPTVTSGHSATGDVKYSVRWQGGKFWVLAGAHNGGGQSTFSIPCVGDATAVVEGENRSVPVNGGQFTDSFADRNSVHVYRLDGGSRCGL